MGNRNSRYATEDPKLMALLESVMGNSSAANLYWSFLMSEQLDPFHMRPDFSSADSCIVNHHELGGVVAASMVRKLDHWCTNQHVSRFAPVLVSFAVLMHYYGDVSKFYVTHNYGMNGTSNRKLKYPFTKIDLNPDSSPSFQDLCLHQHATIQHSSYHLCIPALPYDDEKENRIDPFLGVFLIDPNSGHTRDLIADALTTSSLSLVLEILHDESIVVRIHYNTSVFSQSVAESIYQQFMYFLDQCLSSSPKTNVFTLPTVPIEQELPILSTFNTSENIRNFPQLQVPLHQLIIDRAKSVPQETVALTEVSPIPRSLTYIQLVSGASRLARKIFTLLPNKPNGKTTSNVAILLNRGMDQIITILAILMAGCAYVPLDPINHPPERIDYILRDSGAVCLVTNRAQVGISKYFLSKISVLDIGEFGHEDERTIEETRPPSLPCLPSTSDLIAYVIYTSGSTGNPKGVSVPHLGIINDVFCVYEHYLKLPSTISNVLFSTNICFDAHVDEVFLPLIFGGSITCLNCNIAEIESMPPNISFIQSTPSVFQVLDIPDSVECVLIGGEKLTRHCLENVFKRRPDRLVINGYGPTETTNESALHIVTDPTDTESIGKPLWNTQFYIMDKYSGKNLVPKGAWGELYIGGLGVTKGYVNLPELTSSVFLIGGESSCSPHFPRNEIVYKTGDLVRINLHTNELEFKGRKIFGQQIKLRGYRIELGEIQYSIISSNREIVRDCHVMVIADQIIAFITTFHKKLSTIDEDEIQFGSLPEYMKPSRMIFVSEFPKNISGKLDIKRLEAIANQKTPKTTNDDTPVSTGEWDIESKIVIQGFISAIGKSLSMNESLISIDTNFFSIGGNSLNLVIFRNFLVDKFPSLDIRLQNLLQLQTVGKISDWIKKSLGTTGPNSSPPLVSHCASSMISSVIIPMSVSSQESPGSFYCVHAAGGQIHTYTYLSEILSKNHGINFFGIQDPFLASSALQYRRLSSFEAMGELYADLIDRHHDPRNDIPIFIGGHSSGGAIAFETAKNLISRGRRVACLFLLDTDLGVEEQLDNPKTSSGIVSLIERMDEIRHYLYNGWREGLMEDYIRATRRSSEEETGGFVSKLMKRTEPTANAWSLIQSILPRTNFPEQSASCTSDLMQMISLLDHHLQIEKKYEPRGIVDCDIIQFTPRETTLEDAPTAPSTPKSAWFNLTLKKWIQVHVPNSNHYNIIRPPNVDILATVIADRIDQLIK